MSSKKPPESNDFFVKYLDEKFKGMDESLRDVRHNQERTSDDISKINVILAKQQEQLEYHIKRTDILENDLKPIKSRYDFIVRLVGVISLIAGFVMGAIKFYYYVSALLNHSPTLPG